MILQVYVDAKTQERLEWYIREHAPNRTIEDLAEAAVAEAALSADNRRTPPEGR